MVDERTGCEYVGKAQYIQRLWTEVILPHSCSLLVVKPQEGMQLSPCWIIDYREQSWMQPDTLLLYQLACPAQSLSLFLSLSLCSYNFKHSLSSVLTLSPRPKIFMDMLFYISYAHCLCAWLVINCSISIIQNSYAWKVRLGNELWTYISYLHKVCFWIITWAQVMRDIYN